MPREELYEWAHTLTQQLGDSFDTCSIINVKSGNCPENCHWCAQSSRYTTGVNVYPLLSAQECVAQARHNRNQGVQRFALVASGRALSQREVREAALIYKAIQEQSDICCCASLGLLKEESLRILFDAGVTTYHCNMETAPQRFSKLCSTHTQADKIATIQAARKVGMRVCSGGIIGMGETLEERIDFALLLRSLEVESIPINLLIPIAGTPLAQQPSLSAEDFLLTVALFRIINPTAYLRISGGRIQLSNDVIRKALYIGINAAITGDMLTTAGATIQDDMQLFREMHYNPEQRRDWEA